MKIYKIVRVEKKVVAGVTCDWCDKTIEKIEKFSVNEFVFTWKTGSEFPEGGSGECIEIDLCIECRAKLIKNLIDLGIKIKIEEWDY